MQIKTINFTANSSSPLYLQLCKKIKKDITDGYLNKDDQLPSIRKMADNLNLSRTTVETAYQQLCLEGYVYALANRGYFIQIEQQDAKHRVQVLNTIIEPVKNNIKYDFSSDSIDPLCFDLPLWKRYIKESLEDKNSIYTYGDPQGEIILRSALQRYTYTMRGVLCNMDQIVIGSSFQSLLQLLCSLSNSPKVVAMEECGFAMAEQVFEDYNYQLIKIPMLNEGISIDYLKKQKIDILYLNSAAVGKSKKPLPLTQRNELLKWAKENQVLIIEDDHNGELRYISKNMPALQGIDISNQIVYIGSFSKLLMPSLRIGYMVLPESLNSNYQKRKPFYSPTASKIEQIALAHYIIDGHLEKQIKKSKKRYEYKSKIMFATCKEVFPDWIISLEETALRIRLHTSTYFSSKILLERASKHHIRIQCDQGDILLSFTSISVEQIKPALLTLKQLWNEVK